MHHGEPLFWEHNHHSSTAVLSVSFNVFTRPLMEAIGGMEKNILGGNNMFYRVFNGSCVTGEVITIIHAVHSCWWLALTSNPYVGHSEAGQLTLLSLLNMYEAVWAGGGAIKVEKKQQIEPACALARYLREWGHSCGQNIPTVITLLSLLSAETHISLLLSHTHMHMNIAGGEVLNRPWFGWS